MTRTVVSLRIIHILYTLFLGHFEWLDTSGLTPVSITFLSLSLIKLLLY